MKRNWMGCGLLTIGLLAGISAWSPDVGSASVPHYGDVDRDGTITIGDAIMALKASLQAIDLSAAQQREADVAPYPGTGQRALGDGKVDVEDALRIARYVVGLVSPEEFQPVPVGPVSFSRDVSPLIQDSCEGFLCHGSMIPKGGMRMVEGEEYDALVEVESQEAPGVMRVKPGDPDHSYMLAKLLGTQESLGGEGDRMPAGEAIQSPDPLPDDQINLIRRWIEEGAKRN
jgi:hypothetical protein